MYFKALQPLHSSTDSFPYQNILFQYQFADFAKVTQHLMQAITELTDTLRKAIDSNLYTSGVFLDFSKAFDTENNEF